MRYEIKAPLWLYPGEAAWHFITLPKELSRRIKRFAGGSLSPFGSLRVVATIGATSWKTSIFPSEAGAFLLPVKAMVRKKEAIKAGDRVKLTLELDL